MFWGEMQGKSVGQLAVGQLNRAKERTDDPARYEVVG
jgi:hypothetical protein